MTWNYSNTSVQTTLTAPVAVGDTSINLASVSGLPITFPYSLILDYGNASVEVVTVTNVVGLTATVTRGQDGTAAQTHSVNAPVVHGVVARDVQEPQNHIAATSNIHGVGASSAVVGTATAQTLTNKSIDGGTNTLTNVPNTALVAIDSAKVTQPFATLSVTTTSAASTGYTQTSTEASRSVPVAKWSAQNNAVIIDEDGTFDIDRGDVSVDTARAHLAAALPSRVFVKATSKPGVITKKDLSGDTFDLEQWQKEDGTVWSRVDSQGNLFARQLVAKAASGDVGDLAEFQSSSGSVLAKINNIGALTTVGITCTGGAAIQGNLTVSGIGQVQYVARSTDGTGFTSTSLINEPVLVLPVATSAIYEIYCRFRYSSTDATAGLAASWTIPAGSTISWETPDGTNGTPPSGSQYSGVLSGVAGLASWSSQVGSLTGSITGVLRTSATAGNLQFQVARTGASGTITILTDSRLQLTRVG